jgi:MinD-like ATPase involved in chromosome partitioning or flagellar assembly
MTSGPLPVGRIPVLVAAAGAAWEAEALEQLDRGAEVQLAKRCVDLTDLLASAGTGLVGVAVVSAALPGLDADSVEALRSAGLGVVLVAAPAELGDGDAERMRRLGIEHLLTTAEIGGLLDTVVAAARDAPPDPLVEPDDPVAGAGRLVAVWGPSGAPGRTTVAVGLATELALTGRDVLLVDADPYGGAVAQHLGVLDEVSGLLAAARAANSGRLDADRLASAARQVGDHLRVLTGLPRPDRWQEVRAAAFDDLLDQAAQHASYVVADVGFSLERDPVDPFGAGAPHRNLMTHAVLERAHDVVVIGAADPVGLTRLARGLVELRDLLPAVRPWVVVNRMRPSLGWGDKEIRGMVEGFVTPRSVLFLPDDRAAADRALMAGQSLAESGDSPLREAMTSLALAVAREKPSAGRRGIRRRRAGRAR